MSYYFAPSAFRKVGASGAGLVAVQGPLVLADAGKAPVVAAVAKKGEVKIVSAEPEKKKKKKAGGAKKKKKKAPKKKTCPGGRWVKYTLKGNEHKRCVTKKAKAKKKKAKPSCRGKNKITVTVKPHERKVKDKVYQVKGFSYERCKTAKKKKKAKSE